METSQLPGPTSWLPLSWAFLENLCSLRGWWHQAKEQIPQSVSSTVPSADPSSMAHASPTLHRALSLCAAENAPWLQQRTSWA